jgi:pilus assembly protein CpaF
MRSHQQATDEDIEAEIGDAVDFVIHIERQPGRRAVSEVVRLTGYDRRTEQFISERVFPSAKGAVA